MTISRYEVLMLTVPELTQDEAKQIENEFDKLVNAAKGKVISFDRWGKFKLTYPIRNNEYGVYFLVRFDVEDAHALLKDIQTLFKVKLNNVVMRHMVSRLDESQSTEYQRPKSLEETPASRDMNSFLKENKMEGLLSMDGKEKKKAEPKADPAVVAEPTPIANVVSNEQAEAEKETAQADQ